MVNIRRALRDYDEAGTVSSLLSVWADVDDHVFITKGSELGVAWQLRGVDFEGCDHTARADVVHRFARSLRQLTEQHRLHLYLQKRRSDAFTAGPCTNRRAADAIERYTQHLNARREGFYELDLYMVLLVDAGLAPRASVRVGEMLRGVWDTLRGRETDTVTVIAEEALQKAAGRLLHKAAALEVQLADTIRPARLGRDERFRFLRGLINYDPHLVSAPCTHDTHLDYWVAGSVIECHRGHLTVGHQHVKVLTMKEPPGHTFAHVLEDLYHVPGEWIACLEWQRIPTDRMRSTLHSRQKHFWKKRTRATTKEVPDSARLVDISAETIVHQHGDALTQMEAHGHFFGDCSMTLVLHGQEQVGVERAAAEALKVLTGHDGDFQEETYNQLNAFAAIMPGNAPRNRRRLPLLEQNFADLAFLFTRDRGEAVSPHLQRPCLAIFETPGATPYAYNLHVKDVGHTAIFGSTGSGKSFLDNFLITQLQQYDPYTVIVDIGRSYEKLADVHGGRFIDLAAGRGGPTLNPFTLEPTTDNLNFLHLWMRVLLEGEKSEPLSQADIKELYAAVSNVYALRPGRRCLANLSLPRELRHRRQRWIQGGQYAGIFDHVEDTLEFADLQVFELGAMADYPDLLQPMLFYVFHRVRQRLAAADRLTVCLMDEVWRLIKHDLLRNEVEAGLKTWRKHNAVMMLATQAAGDFPTAGLLQTVIENCPTKLFLSNPDFNRQQYRDLFHLNDVHLELLANLQPARDVLMVRKDVTKVLQLSVDPKSYWLYTNNAADNARFRAAVAAHGSIDRALDHLATAH